MTVTVEVGAPTARPSSLRITPAMSRLLTAVLVAAVVVGSLLSGIGIVTGQRRLAILPILAVVGIALAIVALTRFAWFVLLLLAIRPSTDVLKFSASDAGTSAANTVSDRGADPSSLIGVAFLLLAILWLAATLWGRHGIRPSSVTIALIAFAIAGALSVIGSSHVQASALQLVRLAAAIIMFVVLEQLITTRVMMRRVLVALFVGLTITIGYTLLVMATGGGGEIKGDFARLTGPFTQSNDYARFLSFLILVGVAVFPYVSRRVKSFLLAVLAVASVFLVMTLTLGAITATLVGCLVIALIQRRAALFGLLGVASIAALTAAPGLIGRISASTTASQVGGGSTGNSVTWRLEFWASLLGINKDNPITGVGLNATQYFTPSAKQPHSDFLSAYVETGILGLLLYLLLLAVLFAATARAVLRTKRDTLEWGVAVGALAVVAAFALVSVAANVIQSLTNFWFVLAIVACALAAGRSNGLEWNREPAITGSGSSPGGAAVEVGRAGAPSESSTTAR